MNNSRQCTEPVVLPQTWGTMTGLAGAEVDAAHTTTLGRMLMQPGASNDAHSHANCSETLYVVSGTVCHTVGGVECVQRAGTAVVPAGVVHRTTNIGSDAAELLAAFPVGQREFTREP